MENSLAIRGDEKKILIDRDEAINTAMNFQHLLMLYESGVKQITTKFEILEDEFQSKHQRNPIAGIQSRIKDPMSIAQKLERKGLAVTLDNMVNSLYDIAGIRVKCPFISDVYSVTGMLLSQEDISLVQLKDYIKNPKKSGYRSLHLIVKVAVYLSDEKREIPVEIQIRTIAMDFWASLEHQLHYKKDFSMPNNVSKELRAIAASIAKNDERMQNLAKSIPGFKICDSVEIANIL